MYDNHTFQPVDVTNPNWRGYVMTCYDIDGFGSFFVRSRRLDSTERFTSGDGERWTPAYMTDELRAVACM